MWSLAQVSAESASDAHVYVYATPTSIGCLASFKRGLIEVGEQCRQRSTGLSARLTLNGIHWLPRVRV